MLIPSFKLIQGCYYLENPLLQVRLITFIAIKPLDIIGIVYNLFTKYECLLNKFIITSKETSFWYESMWIHLKRKPLLLHLILLF